MKTNTPKSRFLAVLGLVLVLAVRVAAAPAAPETTPDGLALVKQAKADLVYRRPGASFTGYTKVVLVEPRIAFRKNWQTDANFKNPSQPVTEADMQKMIAKGKALLLESLATELSKAGYALSTGVGPDVLAVKPTIFDLDVLAPETDSMEATWAKIYTKGVGSATLMIELFDSGSGQLLARAYDEKSSEDNNSTWAVPRNRASNIADARRAFDDWAAMLAQGLGRAKTEKAP